MKRRDLLVAWGLGTSLPLCAAPMDAAWIAQLRERLQSAPVLRGQFEQRKIVKGFKQPLLSKGDFVVARQRGVVWRTREPLANSLVLTRERLTMRQADGTVSQQMDATREPALRGITELMFAVLSADLTVLAQRFKVEGDWRSEGRWHLQLLPLDTAMSQWATRVDIDGDNQVRQVQWQDGLGDISLIRMSGHQSTNSLSREEEALLA